MLFLHIASIACIIPDKHPDIIRCDPLVCFRWLLTGAKLAAKYTFDSECTKISFDRSRTNQVRSQMRSRSREQKRRTSL